MANGPKRRLRGGELAEHPGGELPEHFGSAWWNYLNADIEPVRRYLAYLDDVERSPNTLRAYAHHLKLFWDYLAWAKLAWTDVGLSQPSVSTFGEAGRETKSVSRRA